MGRTKLQLLLLYVYLIFQSLTTMEPRTRMGNMSKISMLLYSATLTQNNAFLDGLPSIVKILGSRAPQRL